ncbi:pentapeptide repeat-containing protein [Chondrinema litorale]|uniref:pentapeptide repeat-containing protein n=1 Tax=Chondrinema litorale TaxID=2994555 RepID=UPI0025437B64|nr:pentapeptide repeat-containing protein [Chondrinema litorale]UZR99986.1 hypothetical protein OQ292_39080 [Chondrinema litorale]
MNKYIIILFSLFFYNYPLKAQEIKTITKADYKDSVFTSKVDFDSVKFIAPANFYHTKFSSQANFNNAQFDSLADFRVVQFDSSLTDFANAHFSSQAKFGGVYFPSLVNFREAKFDSLAYFSVAYFNSNANFIKTQFSSKVEFSQTHFVSLANFHLANFSSLAYFREAIFDSYADFRRTDFSSLADFNKADFNNSTIFGLTTFDSLADFSQAHFSSETYFSRSRFSSLAIFDYTTFDSLANFKEVNFDSLAYFHKAKFNTITDFSFVTFNSEVDFRSAVLPDTLYFNNVKKIEKEIDFTFSRLDPNKKICNIDLVDTDISKIKLRYSRFKLIFPDTIYLYEQKSKVYEQLLNVQDKHGFLSGKEKLDKEYQEFKYLENPQNDKSWVIKSVNHLTNFIQKHWWDYGYNKAKIFWWTFIFVAVFSLINWFLFDEMNEGVYEISYVFRPYKNKEKYLWVKWNYTQYKFNISLQQVIPAIIYTSLIFFGFRMSVEHVNYKNKAGVAYVYFQFVLGLVCLAYIANFIILSR